MQQASLLVRTVCSTAAIVVCLGGNMGAAAPAAAALAFESRLLPWIQSGIDEARMGHLHPPLADTFVLRDGAYGQTLFAKRRLERGDTLAYIPLSRLVTERNCTNNDRCTSNLVVFLARQRALGQSSPFADYLSVLPTTHDCRPVEWEPDFLDSHLQGSFFPAYVRIAAEKMRQDYSQLNAADVSWEDFKWATNTLATRSMRSDKLGMAAPLLFPLLDLALHGDNRNVRCKFKTIETPRGYQEVLHVEAVRRILVGDEIYNSYEYGQSTTWSTMNSWGFITPRTRTTGKTVQLRVLPDSVERAVAHARESLCISDDADKSSPLMAQSFDLRDNVGRSLGFVDFLRRTGQHIRRLSAASSSSSCPIITSPWESELISVLIGSALISEALVFYPTTMEEDDILLSDGKFDDYRAECLVSIRREEKCVLRWWLRHLNRAETYARRQMELNVSTVDSGLMNQNCFSVSAGIYLEQCVDSVSMVAAGLWSDAIEATEQWKEAAMLILSIHLLLSLVVELLLCRLLLRRHSRRQWVVGNRWPALAAWVVIIVVALMEESQVLYRREDHRSWFVKLRVVLELEMSFVWVCAVVLPIAIITGVELLTLIHVHKPSKVKSQ